MKISLGALVLAMALLWMPQAKAAKNPVPSITGPVSPQAVAPGSQGFTLKVFGANFVNGAIVRWNGKVRTTTFISAREVDAQILTADVAAPTSGHITVTNPFPGGGKSSSSYGTVEVHVPTSTIALAHPNVYDRGISVWSSIAADFNNDGKLDIISGSAGILCVLGNGDGTFRFGSFIAPNMKTPPLGMAFGDFNGDNKLDFVFTQNNSFQVMLGKANGTFVAKGSFGNFGFLHHIAVGDFNRDGKMDIAAVDSVGKVSILLGNGDGTFQPQQDYTSVLGPIDLVTADFNGDGILDLAVAGQNQGGAVSLLLGNGDGTFGAPTDTVLQPGVGFNTFGRVLFVDDFDGNGVADLVVLTSDQAAILLGDGSGNFLPPAFFAIGGSQLETFAVGDFNSDGRSDLIFSIQSGPRVNVRFGNGDGTFQKNLVVTKGLGSSMGIVPGDFNTDGLMDFALEQVGEFVFTQQ
jgi:hypothetical protein